MVTKGLGTALKPAWEPIVVARKPLEGTVAANVLKYGTGALNIDACRIGGESLKSRKGGFSDSPVLGSGRDGFIYEGSTAGRWPANVVLSHEPECREVGSRQIRGSGSVNGDEPSRPHANVREGGQFGRRPFTAYASNGTETVPAFECVETCPVRMLDEQSGERPTGTNKAGGKKFGRSAYAHDAYSLSMERTAGGYGDTGGASRFYYCSKASAAERGRGNDHPTVKPLALMSWLVKLITPPGGTVLDPFCGSGSTLIAADRLGFDCIGIDSDPHAIEIAQSRCINDAGMLAEVMVS